MLVVLLSTCAAQRNGRAKTAKAELSFDKGYAEDKKIYFMHTEDSNADVAEKMAALMGSPVL